ncbi:MAG TPA: peptidase dimerization domain-containing protein [Gemmatimonadaceae bacterium]|nr:peptidase dimerization domain-containing protein [Gemmatimonadaceae bacterium]
MRFPSRLAALAVLIPAFANAQGRRQDTQTDTLPLFRFKVDVPADDARLATLKQQAMRMVDSMSTFTQQMVDQVFSFGELGFQEEETSKYLTGILEKNGFTVTRGVAGIPTAWVAVWRSPAGAKPVISLGSDIDDIPQASNKPGVGWHDPLIAGAPGHGEGHNSGMPLNVTAALAVKKIMEREKIPGTIHMWPGVAEEQLGSKAYYVRAGLFKNVDAVLFTHVSNDFNVSWGPSGSLAIISAEFSFKGQSAHAAGAPWRGRSALDAVELMDVAWNFRREHLRTQQRSHYVIKDGGDQPNVVPPTATVWYYFRETDEKNVRGLFALADTIARAAAMMTSTQLDTIQILGSAWDGYFSKPIAMQMFENIKRVGMPTWDAKDQTLARGIERELGQPTTGLDTSLAKEPNGPVLNPQGGGSDDIGDISWNVPTVTLRYPANIPGLPGHNWANAIAMATPIAHKGVTAGAKAQAMTMLDLFLKPTLVTQSWDFFRSVQTADRTYTPLMRAGDSPAIWLNRDIMARYRPEMRKYYYDPTKYKTYLEQLGITYPTVKPETAVP